MLNNISLPKLMRRQFVILFHSDTSVSDKNDVQKAMHKCIFGFAHSVTVIVAQATLRGMRNTIPNLLVPWPRSARYAPLLPRCAPPRSARIAPLPSLPNQGENREQARDPPDRVL